jgi:hypothetical protein
MVAANNIWVLLEGSWIIIPKKLQSKYDILPSPSSSLLSANSCFICFLVQNIGDLWICININKQDNGGLERGGKRQKSLLEAVIVSVPDMKVQGQLILEFRKNKAFDNNTVREFYSILQVAKKGAKSIGRVDLLINDQTIPGIMGKMQFADWKEWATRRPEWAQENLGAAFERFVEQKWKDAFNVAAEEPSNWETSGSRPERGRGRGHNPRKPRKKRPWV